MESPQETGSRDLATIVHDFNNLLGVVLNFTILARERLAAAPESGSAEAEQALKHLERVERAARSAIQLTKELGALIPPKERPERP